MEAAFFDLDKTVIAKASMVAFGRPFYREGLISRRLLLRALYGQLVYMHLGADEARLARMRDSVLALTKGWSQARVREIVEETLDDVVEPIVYDEALDLIREHHDAGRPVYIVSASPEEIVAPLARYLGVDGHSRPAARSTTTGATRARPSSTATDRRRRSPWRRSRGTGHRPLGVVRVQRLGDRHPDARVRRPCGRGQSRPRAAASGAGARMGDSNLHAPGSATRSDADASTRSDDRGGWDRGRRHRRRRGLVVVAPRARRRGPKRRAGRSGHASCLRGADLPGGESSEGDENDEEKQLLHGGGS